MVLAEQNEGVGDGAGDDTDVLDITDSTYSIYKYFYRKNFITNIDKMPIVQKIPILAWNM